MAFHKKVKCLILLKLRGISLGSKWYDKKILVSKGVLSNDKL